MKRSPTIYVVGGLIGLTLAGVAFYLAGPMWGGLLLLLLAYEGWTLVNQYPNDTISEIIWELSKRPFVPWLFGVATGWAITSGFLANPWLIGALLFLQGHFFFQRYESNVAQRS